MKNRVFGQTLFSSDKELPKYYSRLAVLELGSWINECMKDIVKCYPERKGLKEKANHDYIKEIVGKNSGFDFNNNFRKMIKQVSGIVILERIERKMNSTSKQGLESALTKIYQERNKHAHKPIHLTKDFTAPSVCVSLFHNI